VTRGHRARLRRAALLVAGVALTGVLGGTAYRYVRLTSRRPAAAPQDGWRIRGLRFRSLTGDAHPIDVSADDVWLRRVHVGPFRLGFAWTLDTKDVRVDMLADDAEETGGGPGNGAAALTPPAVASIRVDRLRLHVHRDGGDFVDVLARHGEASWHDRRLHLRGGVRVRTGDVDVRVAALDLDPATRRFVAAGAVDPALVDRLNVATERVGRPNPVVLVRALGKLTARGVAMGPSSSAP
jgi:hypothetical protein